MIKTQKVLLCLEVINAASSFGNERFGHSPFTCRNGMNTLVSINFIYFTSITQKAR